MTTPLTGFNFQYDSVENVWRDITTGQVVADEVVIQEMHDHQEATYEALNALTLALFVGSITIAEWQIATALELKDAHIAQAIFGAGGVANMTSADRVRVNEILSSEYEFLTTFADDIASGNVSEAQALARARQYGNASQQSYWDGVLVVSTVGVASTLNIITWQLNPGESCPDCIDLANNSPYSVLTLPTRPGAGATRCRGNCNCTLEFL